MKGLNGEGGEAEYREVEDYKFFIKKKKKRCNQNRKPYKKGVYFLGSWELKASWEVQLFISFTFSVLQGHSKQQGP